MFLLDRETVGALAVAFVILVIVVGMLYPLTWRR